MNPPTNIILARGHVIYFQSVKGVVNSSNCAHALQCPCDHFTNIAACQSDTQTGKCIYVDLFIPLLKDKSQIFSSPEPKAHGELKVYQSSRRLCVCVSVCPHF